MDVNTPTVQVREGSYGSRVVAVEPGGVGFIPHDERHGRAVGLLWMWTSPNFEFATVFVGVIPILLFGETFGQAVAALLLGTALGAIAVGVVSARGPAFGVPQMVLSRLAFSWRGNRLPAGLNAVSGVGWFAVNSVSGALALAALTGWRPVLCLGLIAAVQVGVAFAGHNLVQVFERYACPVLAVVFLAAAMTVLVKATPHTAVGGPGGGVAGFFVTFSAAFGYSAGWTTCACDYTRYLKADTSPAVVALWSGLGVFLPNILLEVVGVAAVTIGFGAHGGATGWFDNPTRQFVSLMPTWLGDATLLAIALGAVAANVINIYSGAISFLAMAASPGDRVGWLRRRQRAVVVIAFGVGGFVVAWSALHDASHKYNNFLLIVAYWTGPWLGVYLTDQLLRRGTRTHHLLFDRTHDRWNGAIAMAIAAVVSVWLFGNQSGHPGYVGIVPKHHRAVGDLTLVAGFLMAATLHFGYRYPQLSAGTQRARQQHNRYRFRPNHANNDRLIRRSSNQYNP